MSIVYSFVARGTTVLAEYQAYHSAFRKQAVERLQELGGTDDQLTFFVDGYRFNVLKANGYGRIRFSWHLLGFGPRCHILFLCS